MQVQRSVDGTERATRSAATAGERRRALRIVDNSDQEQLVALAQRLFRAASDAVAVPGLNDALTRQHIDELMQDMLDVLFPGWFHKHELHGISVDTTRDALEKIRTRLALCIDAALCLDGRSLQADSKLIMRAFMDDLPDIRSILIDDARAAYEGDPAARRLCEVVLAYPGFLAIATHRLAHRLHALQVPLVPRMMSEWAHALTGIDIHPGATFGSRAFIDHGTGVVVGETAVIGDNVKLYHGVTLGALSTRRKRATKRHPTIESDVTLYAHAMVLGGSTVVGRHSVVGASVLLADNLPEQSVVVTERSNLVTTRAP